MFISLLKKCPVLKNLNSFSLLFPEAKAMQTYKDRFIGRIIFLISTISVFLIFSNCSENSSGTEPEPPPPDYNETLSGQVLLENQPEHSNALIYIDGLNIGARTDSGGYFKLQFPDSVRDRSGVFTVYYFVEDYDLDSAKIEMKSENSIPPEHHNTPTPLHPLYFSATI